MTWIFVCGLKREAQLLRTREALTITVVGGGESDRLEAKLDDEAELFPSVILSCGIAGALDPALCVGDVVLDGEGPLVGRLRQAWPTAVCGTIVGRDQITATAHEKRQLRAESGAVAADMETHIAARVAKRRDLPFAALRVISDTAEESLPPAALVGMKPDGGMALGAVLGSLARQPAQLPALIRTGINAGKAMRMLGRVHHALERSGVFRLDLGEFPLDVG